ncbi:MAG TPA: ammonia-forming cytochrome c nitrite reductase subunit c552 [Bdellovibrionales bacterium]|nr:ammonia-forming cytochrome c nitrite reductase subunit c552 [Bdellovibrionales bacterium]
MNKPIVKHKRFRRLIPALVLSAAIVALIAALTLNIFERKGEERNPYFKVVELTDSTDDPAIWGRNFPLQYDAYRRTTDQVRTRFGGSEAIPHTPTDVDPRSVVAQSRLEEDPRLKIMWAGYAFSHDFREERGHAYMFEDQLYTERQRVVQQPGTCLNCHASTYVPMMSLGGGDLKKGFDALNKLPYSEAKNHVKHPVSCIDCHAPDTMKLRVTRPAFIEGLRVAKAAEGIQNYDVNKMATHQEMRTFACAQCHVEYYFKGPEKTLTFPWHKGLTADRILSYYDEQKFKDWVHKDTGAPALKAQHPEFEMWSQGIHARSGVSCTDCHMPFKREGAFKITDHHVRSPMLNVNRSCQTCHRWTEEELKGRVETIQSRTFDMRNTAMNALVELIGDIKAAQSKNVAPEKLEAAREQQRRAQFLLDFVEAENSTGFHAPQEAMRVLGLSIEHSRKGQLHIREPIK